MPDFYPGIKKDESEPESSIAMLDAIVATIPASISATAQGFILDDFGNLDDMDIVETSSEGELEAIETTRVAMENLMVEVNELDCEKKVITLGTHAQNVQQSL